MKSLDLPAKQADRTTKIFVYGTLKRGFRNHDLFCQGVLEIRESQVRGRLYDGPGYPLLQVPDEDILAHGTSRPSDDVATQARLADQVQSLPQAVEVPAAPGPWGTVFGELLSFADPVSRLPAIDRLEGFHPGSRSLYRRVLVRAEVCGGCEVAWVYVVEKLGIKQRRLSTGRWPE